MFQNVSKEQECWAEQSVSAKIVFHLYGGEGPFPIEIEIYIKKLKK